MKKETIIIPATVEEAVAELGGLGALLQATEWKRAAIVAAHVRLGEGEGGKPSNTGQFLSARAFADLGIAGLSSTSTVTRYVKAWLETNGDNYPPRGRKVTLPDEKWPPEDGNLGSRSTPSSIGRQLNENPDLAEAAARALADGAIEHVAMITNKNLSRAVDRKIVDDYGAPKERKSPRPQPSTEDEPDEAYWIVARKALDVILDLLVRMEHGLVPPPDIAIRIDVLRRHDVDDELSKMVGDHT